MRRSDILGYSGSIPDNLTTSSRGIHFEILFDDVAFLDNANKVWWERCLLKEALDVQLGLLPVETIAVNPAKPLTLDKYYRSLDHATNKTSFQCSDLDAPKDEEHGGNCDAGGGMLFAYP